MFFATHLKGRAAYKGGYAGRLAISHLNILFQSRQMSWHAQAVVDADTEIDREAREALSVEAAYYPCHPRQPNPDL